jgi:hypothetical protein
VSVTSERTDSPVVESPTGSTDVGVVGRAKVDEGLSARRRLQARLAAARAAASSDTTTVAAPDTRAEETQVLTDLGPRPRVSMLATLALMLAVTAALAVLTGALAGPGLVLGAIAAIVSLAGIRSTSSRHVTGRSLAALGLVLGVAAAVVGGLALDGLLPWLSTGSDQVTRVRDWLDGYLPWLFRLPA